MKRYKITYSFYNGNCTTFRSIYYKTYSKKSLFEYAYKRCKAYEEISIIEFLGYER